MDERSIGSMFVYLPPLAGGIPRHAQHDDHIVSPSLKTMPTDPLRLDLYAQLLDAVAECQDQAYRIEFHSVEVPANLREDESPPIPPDAVRAIERVDGLMRRLELAAPERVVRLAAELRFESTQLIAHAVDRPRRAR
jgi:hypothetical protein